MHLYEKGQSQRGAAFKVPFACLLATQCQPLIEKCVDRSVSEEEAYQNGRVDLYIPAPSAASRSQASQYHLATRNFFAWIFRRSVVGDQLGTALIGLLNSMDEFRELDADNVPDLLEYIDEEGYLDMRNQPNHALAILHVAEVLQIKNLYIDAFAHCVGMSERLYKHSEYSVSVTASIPVLLLVHFDRTTNPPPPKKSPSWQPYALTPVLQRISVASRKLIRPARVDMDFRLSRGGAMLGDLLQEELSEAHLGLSTGARAHLDRFRAYIRGFYLTRFGSFPPQTADLRCNTIFRPEVYRVMQADFEALYEYLVDEKFTPATADPTPSVAQGGLCSLQSVHEFDLRHKFSPLPHPLPLLPEPIKAKESRRRRSLPWFIGGARVREGKLRPDQRLVAHAGLMRATNCAKTHLLDNRLVLAYRQFEEDSVLVQHKGEPGVSPGDTRKVRWLFIYAMYQTLRSCAQVPSEVKFTKVGYHLSVSTKGMPPWEAPGGVRPSASFEGREGGKPRQQFPERSRSISAVPLLSPISSPEKDETTCNGIEIKPDVDYFALTHQEESPTQRGRGTSGSCGTATPRSRSQSLTRSMSIRRSLSVFRNSSHRPTTSATGSPSRKVSTRSKSSYHEIIVLGYGNGTNNVIDVSTENVAPTSDMNSEGEAASRGTPQLSVNTALTATRSASTSSTSSYSSSVSASTSSTAVQSMVTASTTPTTLVDPQSPISSRNVSTSWKSTATTLVSDVQTPTTPSFFYELNPPAVDYDNLTFPITRKPSVRKSVRDMYSNDDMLLAASVSEPPPLPRRSSKRCIRTPEATLNTKKRWSLVDVVASLREEEDSDSSDEAASNASKLQPSPLRICKAAAREAPRTPIRITAGEDDVFRSSDDWERTVHSALDVSPPCAWEQFADLGGLQPIHLLTR